MKSKEKPNTCLRVGEPMAVLSYLDFFLQRRVRGSEWEPNSSTLI